MRYRQNTKGDILYGPPVIPSVSCTKSTCPYTCPLFRSERTATACKSDEPLGDTFLKVSAIFCVIPPIFLFLNLKINEEKKLISQHVEKSKENFENRYSISLTRYQNIFVSKQAVNTVQRQMVLIQSQIVVSMIKVSHVKDI